MVKQKKKLIESGITKKGIVGIVALIFIIVGVPLAIYFGWFGAIYQLEAPPEEYSTGYAILNFRDPYSGEMVTDVDCHIYFFSNETELFQVSSGTPFYVPEACYFFAMKPGYWNASGSIYAQGTTPAEAYNQTYNLFKIPPKNYINFSIIAIDGVYGSYSSADIPDGTHTILFTYSIGGIWRNQSAWGVTAYVPPSLIPSGSYAEAYGVYLQTLWIGWNGSVTNYQLQNAPVDVYRVFDVGIYNTTFIYAFHYSGQFSITAEFKNISNASLYFGLLDDVYSYTIPF